MLVIMSQMHGAVETMAALDDLALLPRILLLFPSLCCNCVTRAAGARLRRRLCSRTWTWCCWPWMRWWMEGERGGGPCPAAVCALLLWPPCSWQFQALLLAMGGVAEGGWAPYG